MDTYPLSEQPAVDRWWAEKLGEMLTVSSNTQQLMHEYARNGKIVPHDLGVLERSLAYLLDNPLKSRSVNIHGRTIEESDLLISLLQGLPEELAHRLVIEITEEYIPANLNEFGQAMDDLGVLVALDDLNKRDDWRDILDRFTPGIIKVELTPDDEWILDHPAFYKAQIIVERVTTKKEAQRVWALFPNAWIQGFWKGGGPVQLEI